MRPDMVLHAGEGRIEISERPPRMVERAAVAFREDDIGALVAFPDLAMRLAKGHLGADIEQQRNDGETNGARPAHFGVTPFALNTAAASSVLRNARNALATSACPVSFATAAVSTKSS